MYKKNVSRFSFNLAPRLIHVVTRAVHVGAMRCHSTGRRRHTLRLHTLRGAEKIETELVHQIMYKKRLKI